MQLAFVLLSLLLLAVALFALQNTDAVTLRFWPWEVRSSVAVLTLTASAVGAIAAVLVGWMARLTRWRRARASGRSEGHAPADSPGPRSG